MPCFIPAVTAHCGIWLAVGLINVVPFLVESMLKQNGGRYSKAADWQPHVVSGA
jgi:hypothetical protein